MFGYVTVDKPNILIKDFATYKSYYCGLCKVIGENNSQLTRLTTNYDIVLLALLVHNYENAEPKFVEEHCVLHPIGRKNPIAKSPELLGRVADINLILGYFKAVDDVNDDGKRRLVANFLRGKYKKLKRNYPKLCEEVSDSYGRLCELEKDGCRDVETLASEFGHVMEAVARASTEKCDALLERLLFHVGRWIYYIDAIDDLKRDTAEKKYNPFSSSVSDDVCKLIEESQPYYRQLLYGEIEKVQDCYNKMEISISEGALSNIIYRGLRSRTEQVLKCKGEKCKETRL